MNSKELRDKFLDFFKEKGHTIIPGSSLIPEHDPTVLFTTAGMHPLVPFLLGEKHPQGRRLVNFQKCLRTDDIEQVGDSWHLTFFEMLGNWSLGDPEKPDGIGAGFWKKEAIEWSFEFLTGKKWLAIPLEKLSVTVFAGDQDALRDKESAKIWHGLGIPQERIYYLPKEDNWWGPAGQTGPCGPCSEMFYDTGKDKCSSSCKPGCGCGKYVEIWNDVFMEYNRKIKNQKSKCKMTIQNSKIEKSKNHNNEIEYEYVPLAQKNVDTGMGVERTAAVLSGYDNVYETELFQPLIKKIKELAKRDYKSELVAYRIIADHIKAAAFILSENIEPSNVERGYVLRRLIRRSIRQGRKIGIKDIFCHKVAETVIKIYQNVYPELYQNQDFIFEQLIREEEKFKNTLEQGLKELNKLFRIGQIQKITPGEELKVFNRVDAKKAFFIYQTYGFPFEMIQEELAQRALLVDKKEFNKELKKHQEISRKGAEQKFKGGLADHSEQTTKYHTATHLLLAALRKILGEHIQQKGSNITAERLRFDFSHKEKLTKEEIEKVEDLVNQKIKEDLQVKWEEMSLIEAQKQGATGVFGEKYGERVKVYTISNPENGKIFSREICGGPHIKRTSKLGHFKIKKEESSSAGVRRIKAVLK